MSVNFCNCSKSLQGINKPANLMKNQTSVKILKMWSLDVRACHWAGMTQVKKIVHVCMALRFITDLRFDQ
jgi:hypothetical protein